MLVKICTTRVQSRYITLIAENISPMPVPSRMTMTKAISAASIPTGSGSNEPVTRQAPIEDHQLRAACGRA